MLPLRVELAALCRACEAPIPLVAVVPDAACERCHRAIALPASLWQQLFEQIVADAPAMPDHDERDSYVQTPAGTIRRVYRRLDASCTDCNAPLPIEMLLAASAAGHAQLPCPGCGRNIWLRRLPEINPTVALFAGEALDPPEPIRREATERPCPQCGAPLPLQDAAPGSVVRCAYCAFDAQLPKEEEPPLRPVRAFHAIVDAAPTEAAAALAWTEVEDVASDADGNVYVAGWMAGGAVWSFDAELRLRWVKREVTSPPRRIALVGPTVVTLGPNPPFVHVFAAVDGRPLRPPPALAKALSGSRAMGGGDGATLLVADSLGQVERCAIDGSRRPLFGLAPAPEAPPEPERGFFGKLFGGSSVPDLPAEEHLSSLTLEREAVIAGAPDGGIAVGRRVGIYQSYAVSSYGPHGEHRFDVPLDGPRAPAWLAVGRHGAVHVARDSTEKVELERVSAAGAVDLVHTRARGGPLDRHDRCRIAELPDGSFWLFHGSRGAVRKLAPDGRVLLSNTAAQQADQRARLTR